MNENSPNLANSAPPSPWRFCTAPCMDWTDRHCRHFWRQLTRRSRLYSEMVTTGALLHGDIDRHLNYGHPEHPLALQLGGSIPQDLAHCAKLAEARRYDEVNLNCGCPSDRVKNGRFGACLMAEPELVRDCVAAMREAVDIPVTVKQRIGIDHQESFDELRDFVGVVAEGGCEVFIVHARKAWLEGLSPKQNREIPPLNYAWVYALKKQFPHLTIVLNGGIQSLEECEHHLTKVDGVMLGRAAYQTPWLLSRVDSQLFGAEDPALSRESVIIKLSDYVETYLEHGGRLNHITRHILGLFHQQPGGRLFRRALSEGAHRIDADATLLLAALAEVRQRHGEESVVE
ncbi:MAG: tRNA dihydrouridine(20/20a) synthase DusA [Luminiphilus sp.]|nr:tRNA dihydrouridine(20/20a) synthase DusA [Luminiphilus sp.]